MKLARALAIALVCSLPLAACNGNPPLLNGSSIAQSAPEVFANAQKSLTVTHLAYDAIGRQILSATQSGLLKGENAATVQVVYRKAKGALDIADTAERVGNTTNLLQAIQEANSAITQVKNLVGVN